MPRQVLLQLHRLVGSLDFLGNPNALFADLKGGVRTFFREPQRGALKGGGAFAKGLVKGTGGLVGGVLGGGGSAALSLVSAVNTAGVIGWSSLSGDAQFQHRRQLAAQQKASGMKQGLRMGAEALSDGLRSGLGGLIRQPVRGAKESGVRGVVGGVARGVVGVPTKLFAGFAGFGAKVAEGAQAEAKKVVVATQDSAAHVLVLRVRQPRLLADGVLRPYQRAPPVLAISQPDEPPTSEAVPEGSS